MKIVILGLSITSSWGNGHATTYRSLIRGLAAAGHQVLFLERDVPWYADNRDDPQPAGATTLLYGSVEELIKKHEGSVAAADLAIVGSFVPEGIAVGDWVTSVAQGVTAFYDIDTPVTMAALEATTCEYLSARLIPRFDIYLSFTGGPVLQKIEGGYGSPMARVLYCSVDTEMYLPQRAEHRWKVGYLGTWSEDRQPLLEALLLDAARVCSADRFAVAGPLYPESVVWPQNVDRVIHLAPSEHARFYAAQDFTLNITRDAMKRAGFSPSVRLFEAGACGVPIISDWWEGLDSIFRLGDEILISGNADDTLRHLRDVSASERVCIGAAARARVLAEHTPARRAAQLVEYFDEAASPRTWAVRA